MVRVPVLHCLATALLAWPLAGCSPPTKPAAATKPAAGSHDHDHADEHAGHDHPETLAEGITELEQAARDVAEKLAAEGDDTADAAIHAAGHVVDDLKQLLAKQGGLAAEARDAATKSLDELFEAFNKVDEAMHAGGEDARAKAAAAHDAVKETIEAAVKSLKDRFARTAGGKD